MSLTGIECQILGQAQVIPRSQTFTVEIVPTPLPQQITQKNTSERKHPKSAPPLSMKLRPRLPAGEPTQSRTKYSAPTIQRTKPRRGGCTNQSGAATNLIQSLDAGRNLNSRRDLTATPIPKADHNSYQNPNADLNQNSGGSRNPRRKSNR